MKAILLHPSCSSRSFVSSWLSETRVAPIMWIALAAFALRAALIVAGPMADIERAWEPDSRRYLELGASLATTGRFARGPEDSGAVHVPLYALRVERGEAVAAEAFRTPGYPLFLAAFGPHGALIVQAMLGAVSVWLVYVIAMKLFEKKQVALIAAGITALHPALLTASASLLSETLFTTFTLGAIALFVHGRNRWEFAMLAGLLIGLATMVRPIGILLGLALAMWLVAVDRGAWRPALCVLVASLILPLGWMGRNAQVGHGFAISSVPPINDYFYTVAYMRIADEGGDYGRDWQQHVDRLHAELRGSIQPNETTGDAMKRLARAEIKDNPKTYAKVIARSGAKFMTDHSAHTLMARLGRDYQPSGLRDRITQGNFTLAGMPDPVGFVTALSWTAWNLLLCAAMAIGAITMLYHKQFAALLLLGGLVTYFLLATQATGLERFRVPIIGLQAICIAAIAAYRRRPAACAPAG